MSVKADIAKDLRNRKARGKKSELKLVQLLTEHGWNADRTPLSGIGRKQCDVYATKGSTIVAIENKSFRTKYTRVNQSQIIKLWEFLNRMTEYRVRLPIISVKHPGSPYIFHLLEEEDWNKPFLLFKLESKSNWNPDAIVTSYKLPFMQPKRAIRVSSKTFNPDIDRMRGLISTQQDLLAKDQAEIKELRRRLAELEVIKARKSSISYDAIFSDPKKFLSETLAGRVPAIKKELDELLTYARIDIPVAKSEVESMKDVIVEKQNRIEALEAEKKSLSDIVLKYRKIQELSQGGLMTIKQNIQKRMEEIQAEIDNFLNLIQV